MTKATLLTKDLVWECLDCGLKIVHKDGKKRKVYPEIDVSKYDSFPQLAEARRLKNAEVRRCRHEHRVYGENYCKRCGKPISNPTSLKHKMGPVCRCKVQERVNQWKLEREIKEMIKVK